MPMLVAFALAVADPVPPTPAREASVDAAVQIVRNYYAAVSRRDYRTAYALWHGRNSLPEFKRGYARTAWVKVTPIPPYDAEGGAGSIYAEIKVRVDAALNNGAHQHFTGSYTLRRVNDVDGATAAQRRWHIIGARLKAMPAGR